MPAVYYVNDMNKGQIQGPGGSRGFLLECISNANCPIKWSFLELLTLNSPLKKFPVCRVKEEPDDVRY